MIGSPESVLLSLMRSQVSAYFHGRRWHPSGGGILSMAKLPGAQACAEKTGGMTVGALFGQRSFFGGGALSLDEVFSGEQLLYDLEIKDHVEQLVQGLESDCDPARCVSDVREGLREGSFLGLDSTLESFRKFNWNPDLFERNSLGSWQARGARDIRRTARERVRDLVSRHEYEPEPELRRALDAILARARAELMD